MKWYMAIFIMKWKLVLIWDVILKSYLILSIKEFTQERLGTIFNLRHVFSVTHEQVFLDKCPWQLLLVRVFEGQIFFFWQSLPWELRFLFENWHASVWTRSLIKEELARFSHTHALLSAQTSRKTFSCEPA